MSKPGNFIADIISDYKEKNLLREEVRILKNRVSTLEIQGGRLKEERDEAREHLKRIRSSIAIMT
jgi:FtsZ-binding cell division protein ZapB